MRKLTSLFLVFLYISCTKSNVGADLNVNPVEKNNEKVISNAVPEKNTTKISQENTTKILSDNFEKVLDFVQYYPLSEINNNDGTWVDFTTLQGDSYILGGWRTNWDTNRTKIGEETGIILRNDTAKMYLPVYKPEKNHVFRLKIWPSGGKNLRFAINNHELEQQPVNINQWNEVIFNIPSSNLNSGENLISIGLRGSDVKINNISGRAVISQIWFGQENSENSEFSLLKQNIPAKLSNQKIEIFDNTKIGFFFPQKNKLYAKVKLNNDSKVKFIVEKIDGSIEEINSEDSLVIKNNQELILPLEGEGRIWIEPVNNKNSTFSFEGGFYIENDNKNVSQNNINKAKNLIIILIDTLRADHVKAYNEQTPVKGDTLDEIANNGILFVDSMAQENWTKPSVATVLTSLYPSVHTAQEGEATLPADVNLISEILQKKGFITSSFIANGYVSESFGFNQGWNLYRNYVREGRRNKADAIYRDATEWIKQHYNEQFFMYIHTIDPHVPYIPPKNLIKMYYPMPYSGPVEASKTAKILEDVKSDRLHLNDNDKQMLHALYNGEITYQDENMEGFFNTLNELGLDSNTIVWITADHGEEFFEHDSVGHGHSLYQELLHVPLILYGLKGSLPEGQKVYGEAGLIDIIPTSLDLLGIEKEEYLQGNSLLPLVFNNPQPLYNANYSFFLLGRRALKLGKWKFMQHSWGSFYLYNLESDPQEKNNLITRYPVVERFMHALMSKYLNISKPRSEIRGGKKVIMNDELRNQLRALGYVH